MSKIDDQSLEQTPEPDGGFYSEANSLVQRSLQEREVGVELDENDGGEVAGGGSIARQMFRVFIQNKMAVISSAYIFVLVMLCLIVPFFYGQSYWSDAGATAGHNSCFTSSIPGGYGSAAPSWHHVLGCTLGIDNWGLLFYAGRFSLFIGMAAGIAAMVIGTFYGVIAGYRGGRLDSVMMRLNDVFLSIPGLYLLILVIVIYGQNLWSLIFVLGFTGWFGIARLMRAEAQILRDREFSQASRSMGATGRRVVWKHVLPNSVSTMMTAATFSIGDAVIILSTLGFLGLALTPPDYDWGTIINNATNNQQIELGYWWTLVPVAVVFILFVLSTNYIGDALRDAFEVRLQER
jgi:peptide/nickel transport system permease protein